jgi:hypothetical protein
MNSIISPALENKAAVINGPKVGDILVSTSGYEACIAHFAKVVAVTKSSVKIARIGSNDTYKGGNGMEWDSVPDMSRESDALETKRFKPCGETYKVKDTSYSTFYVWGGQPISCYNYH